MEYPKLPQRMFAPEMAKLKAEVKKNKVCLAGLSASVNVNQGVTQRLLGTSKQKKTKTEREREKDVA